MRTIRSAVAACALAVVVALVGLGSAHGMAARSPASTTAVPVTRCATQFAVRNPPNFHTPKALRVPASAGGLTAYTNTQGYALGPAGYQCSGSVGADGTSTLLVWPSGQAQPRQHSSGAGLSLTVIPACVGCQVYLTCPYLGVMQRAARSYQVACPGEPPPGERASVLGKRLSAFVDPPSVRGLGWPSGRGLRASGLVGFLPGHLLQAFSSSCTLPAAMRSVCTVGAAAEQYLIAAGVKP